jgi:zinc transporter ZupT
MLFRLSIVHCLLASAGAGIEDEENAALSGDVVTPDCPAHGDDTSMMQISSLIDSSKVSESKEEKTRDEEHTFWNATSRLTGAALTSAISAFDASLHSGWNTTQRCYPFESSIAANGMPVCVEAFIFGLFATASMPIGAILGVIYAPMSQELIAMWLALGSGALTFAVATQLFGDHLFAMVAISRKFGPIQGGCYGKGGDDVCSGKLLDLVEMMFAALIGAWLYVRMTKWLETIFVDEKLHAVDGVKLHAVDGSLVEAKEDSRSNDDAHGSNVAIAMWFGMLLDSVPEALMIGLMTNQHKLKFGFMVAIFLSNFPEAFSGAGILRENNWPSMEILFIWSLIFLVTGSVAAVGSFAMPESCAREAFTNRLSHVTAIVQGVSGGMMLAMMASAMLPESYRRYGASSGLFFVLGFVISVAIQTVETYFATPQEILHGAYSHQTQSAGFGIEAYFRF